MDSFKKKGWFLLPVDSIGYLIGLIFLLFNIWFFLGIDKNAHSVSDTFINFFPYFISFSVLYYWVARNLMEK